MAKHRIDVRLDDEEEAFLKWLVKYDNEERTEEQSKTTAQLEMRSIFYTELRELMELYSQGGEKPWEK